MDKKTVPAKAPESSGLKDTLKFLEDDVKKKKRGSYKQKECPYCHTMVGNLGNHVKMKHQAEAKDSPPVPPPAELTKGDLLPGAVPKEKKDSDLTAPVYYCQDCKAELRRDESECWNCHAVLNWEGI